VFESTTPGNGMRVTICGRRCRACDAGVTAGHLESDAALLWCRTRAAQPDPHIAIVDGSLVRTAAGRDLCTLPAPVPFRETVA